MNSKNGDLAAVQATNPVVDLPEVHFSYMRRDISDEQIHAVVEELMTELYKRLDKEGRKANVSTHEIQGAVTEEYTELIEATRGGIPERMKKELFDMAIACIFGSACINAKTIEW